MGHAEAGDGSARPLAGVLIRALLFLLFVRVGVWVIGALLYLMFGSLLVASALGSSSPRLRPPPS